jgi:hypothetical protein
MADEIETTAQLIELAVLRDVVIHELTANRDAAPDPHGVDSPPEELHAPGSPDGDVAMTFCTRLEGARLGVRCRIETCNAYGSFMVDGEAIFDLPGPVSSRHPHIVDEFTEQVGAPAVFPYLRAAVASLAALMSVPASPLPVFRAGDVTLTHDDGPVVEEEPSEPFIRGTVMRTTDDGGQEHVADFFIDEQTGTISRIGGEGETPEFDKFLDAWAELPRPDEISWESMVRRRGEAAVRESKEAAAHIEVEDAFVALNTAMEKLDLAMAAARDADADSETVGDVGGPGVPTALIDAAERVRDGWERVRNAISN